MVKIAGASIPPEAMMHFPPVSDSPLFSTNFQTLWKIFLNLTFSRQISRFSSAKIYDYLFFSHRPKISNFPLFSLFQYISPCFAKIIISPYFFKFHPWFRKIHLLFTHFMCISFPPTLTTMHLCITQCTYWTPLKNRGKEINVNLAKYVGLNWTKIVGQL